MNLQYAIGPAQVRPAERCVLLHGQPVALGARAFDLLLALVERRDRIVGKDELMALVWPGLVVEDGNLAVHVSALRKLLGARAIATVPGRGYRFTAPVLEQVVPVPALAEAAPPAGPRPPAMPPPAAPPAAETTTPTLERLLQKLSRATDDTDIPATVGWLPTALTPLLGRDAALAELQPLLLRSPCLTLTGAGGAGKTRLALALAEAVCSEFPDGCWWIALDTLADAAALPDTLARALGASDPRLPPQQSLLRHLQGRRALLVLDNCEHLLDACAELAARLLRESPGLRLLATSREALRIAGEQAWRVPPLATPGPDDDTRPEPQAHGAAMQMLLQRIAQHEPGFALTRDNAADLARICRGLEGLPLALELVAAQVGALTPAQIAARLHDSLPLLREGERGGMRHHQTMAAAIDWGVRLLGAHEQALLRRLAVFAGGCTLEAAVAACEDLADAQGQPLGADAVAALAGRLYRASLLTTVDSAAGPRLRLLEPIRQFALGQAEAEGCVDAVRQRLLTWYGQRCQALAAQLAGPQQAQAYATLTAEFDNLRAGLAWSLQHDLGTGLRLASDLWRFWQVKGHAQELLVWFERALAGGAGRDDVPDALRADACNAAGVMARTCGRYDEATRWHDEALAQQRRLGHRRGEASALNNLCVIARDRYDHAQVERTGREALALARELGDRALEGLALMHLGAAQRGQEQPAEAATLFQQSLALFRELGDRRSQGTLLNFLGRIALDDGRWAEAERAFDEALALNRELDDYWGLGISGCNQAALHAARGDDEAALHSLLRSLVHYRRAGVRHGLEVCFEQLAGLAHRRGHLQRAAWCWGVVEQLERDIGKQHAPGAAARRAAAWHVLATEMSEEAAATARAAGLHATLAEAYEAVLPEGGLD
jgi:predicted ATPase/DNA-binding winged helix-turn-helix (wHTH) protein